MTKPQALSGAAAVLLAISAAPAAAIECSGAYQILSTGEQVSTPYCRELNLARVARGYGISTSFARLRRSESEKQTVCAAIGHDNRVADICQRYRPDSGERRIK